MNIISFLKEKDFEFDTLQYYNENDFAHNFYFYKLCDSAFFIQEYYLKKYEKKLESVDSFVDYLFMEYVLKYEKVTKIFQNKEIENYNMIISTVKSLYENTKKEDVIKIILKKYGDIFCLNNEIENILNITILKIIQINRNIILEDELLDELITNYYLIFFDVCTEELENNLKKDKKIQKKMFFDSKNMELIIKYRMEYFIKNVYSFLSEEVKKYCARKLYSHYKFLVDDFHNEASEKKGFSLMLIIKELDSIFFNFDSCDEINDVYVEYGISKEKEEKRIKKYLNENYMCEKKSISLENYRNEIRNLENKNIPKNWRILDLTHIGIDNKIITCIEMITLNHKEEILINGASTTYKTDDFFTASKLSIIPNILSEISYNLFVWFEEENRKNIFFEIIEANLIEIFEYYEVDKDKNELKKDIDSLKLHINNALNSQINEDYSNSCSRFIVALFEKILREIYIKLEKYGILRKNKIDLRELLEHQKIIEILGINTVKWIKYYLIGENGIGKNYRNKLSHGSEINSTELNITDVTIILWLQLTVINSFYVHKHIFNGK